MIVASPATSRYEAAFADAVGAGHAMAFWKGRVALYSVLQALGVGEGDEVILPGYTCVMDVNPIMYLGAKPVYVDIQPDTFNIDPALLPASITPRTKVILAQHTYGYPCALDEIIALAAKHDIAVVEDCCLALGSTYRGRPVGTHGVAGYFSFQWNKTYTSGLGGMVVTSDDVLVEKMRSHASQHLGRPTAKQVAMLAAQLAVYRTLIYPKTTSLAANLFRVLTRMGLVVGSSGTDEYAPDMAAGFFKAMSGVQVRSGVRQLRKLAANIAHRRRMTGVYDDLLDRIGWPARPTIEHADPVLVRYPVRVADKPRALVLGAKRLAEIGSWFECPLHPSETPLEAYGYQRGMCPVAERAADEVVNLPTHPRANEQTARRAVDVIEQIGPPEPSSGMCQGVRHVDAT